MDDNINPIDHMKKIFNNYNLENNPVSPFFSLSSNHPNIIGSRELGIYSAAHLINFLSE